MSRTSNQVFASVALLLPLLSFGCYSEPDVSEPPTLDKPKLIIEPLTQNLYPGMVFVDEVPIDSYDKYRFTVEVNGTAGRFENGTEDPEQWIFRSVEYTMTFDGQPITTNWEIGRAITSELNQDSAWSVWTKEWFEYPATDAGKTFYIQATVADARGMKSNTVELSVLLKP
jgi:hypothetical protein